MKVNGKRDDLTLITTGEAASQCRVSLQAMRGWIRDGRLKAFQTPGRHARIEVAESYLEKRSGLQFTHAICPPCREKEAARIRPARPRRP